MTDQVYDFIAFEMPDLLVSTAEDIGYHLGRINANQTLKIYQELTRNFTPIADKSKESQELKSLHLLKPKMVYLVAVSSPRERPALQRFQYALIEAIDCVIEIEGADRFERLKRLYQFVEAIICYQRYFKYSGTRSDVSLGEKRLRDKVNDLQVELDRLPQFVYDSKKKLKVFLSHSHVDKPFVERLRTDLEARNISTWYDNKELNIGDILSNAISEGIKQSWCFLIVISPNTAKSNWVKYELDEAYEAHISQRKRILPVLIGNLADADIPQRLKKHIYADFRKEAQYNDAFDILYRTIIREASKSSID